jgi:hypothetical protein
MRSVMRPVQVPVALLLWRPPRRPTITLWSTRLQAASIRMAGLAVTLAWTLVVAVARLCVFSLRIAWAHRHTAATPLLVASRYGSAATVPLRLAPGAATRLRVRLRALPLESHTLPRRRAAGRASRLDHWPGLSGSPSGCSGQAVRSGHCAPCLPHRTRAAGPSRLTGPRGAKSVSRSRRFLPAEAIVVAVVRAVVAVGDQPRAKRLHVPRPTRAG